VLPIKRLGEVVEFLDSKRRPITESDRRAGPYPYYGANGLQGTIDDYIFDEPLVLLAEDGGHFGEPERGIAYRISGKTWVNNHAHVLRPTPEIDLAYLCRVLENYDVTPFVTGTTRGKLTKAGASEIVIPLPPLAEQRRIAEVLDRAEALRAKRRAALAQLDFLIQSLFLDLFADPASNGWAMTNIGSVAKPVPGSIRTGPFGSQLLHGEFTDSGIAVLGIDNAVANEFRWGERRFISEAKYRQLKRYTVHPGDVLITIMGTCGRCAVVPDDIPAAINTKHLCCITLDAAKCTPVFLHAYFLRHPIARQYLTQTAKGAIMSGLNMGIIKEMPVPLPPLSLQREFARRVTAVEKLKAAQRASLAELDALFATLQHRAFKGKL
jgi:type I restriction enzyme S subunit